MSTHASAAPGTFPALVLHHARVRGARPAMREKDLGIWQTLTWADVAGQVRELAHGLAALGVRSGRSEEHTSELQSLMRISYAVFCLQQKKRQKTIQRTYY